MKTTIRRIMVSAIGNRSIKVYTAGGVFSWPRDGIIELIKRDNLTVFEFSGTVSVISKIYDRTITTWCGYENAVIAIDNSYEVVPDGSKLDVQTTDNLKHWLKEIGSAERELDRIAMAAQELQDRREKMVKVIESASRCVSETFTGNDGVDWNLIEEFSERTGWSVEAVEAHV